MTVNWIVLMPAEVRNRPIDREWILATKFGLALVEQRFRLQDGSEEDFVFCRKKPGVTVCTVTEEGNLVLVGQYKEGAQKYVFEFPAGMLWSDEDLAQRATSELREETGYQAEEIRSLCASPSVPGPRKIVTAEYLFIATGARRVAGQKLDKGETGMSVVELDPRTFIQWREEGKIISSGTREAFGLALEKGYIYL